MSASAKVTVGVPTFNGERFLRRTLDSLLSQDFEHIEVLISDNASTDATPSICREYARLDGRVQYHPCEENVGAVANFNRLVTLASGKYFMWAGDHDLWHGSYVSRCVSALERDSEVVLAYAMTRFIDENDEVLLDAMPDRLDTRGYSPASRFTATLWRIHVYNLLHGVMRLDLLQKTGLLRNVWCPDHLLISELALYGTFAQERDILFYRRRNRPPEAPAERKTRILQLLDPTTAAAKGTRDERVLYRELRDAHWSIIRDSQLHPATKWRLYLSTVASFCCRFGVPCTGWHIPDRLLDFGLHRLRLRRLFE